MAPEFGERPWQPVDQSDETPAAVDCWRCGKSVDAQAATCPFCAARLRETPRPAQRAIASDDAFVRMLCFFAGLLAVSVGHGLILFGLASAGEFEDPAPEAMLMQIGIFELISTGVVLAALVAVRVPSEASPPFSQRVTAWVVAWPLLAASLAFNVGYHWFLREGLGIPAIESEFAGRTDLLPWVVLLICVQPAIFEELFFRYTAMNVLQTALRPATVILLSSVMFGLAHIGVPLSIPVLVTLGLLLGWMRYASGSVLLPMLMHFVHNAVVVYFEMMQVIP